jgi:hypothetical protein
MSSIDRIRKLIALSESTNEHEARSAAYLACKMIRDGGYRIVEAAADPWDERPRPPPWAAWSAPREDAGRSPPPPRSARDERPRRAVPCEIAPARRSGLCAVCGEEFERGDEVAYPTLEGDTSLGAVHADCRARWTAPIEL